MKELYKALAEFQQKVPVIYQETTGHNYKYASIGQIITKIKPILAGCHLGFNQRLNDGKLITMIFHIDSGESIESVETIPKVELRGMNPYQSYGSGITYYRRYALATILGLVTDKDEDATGDYDNGINDPAISSTSFGEDLIKQLHKRIVAIHKQLSKNGDIVTLSELIEAGEGDAITEFNSYKSELVENQAKSWIDDQLTKPRQSGTKEALRQRWKDAQAKGWLTEYVQEAINKKVAELDD